MSIAFLIIEAAQPRPDLAAHLGLTAVHRNLMCYCQLARNFRRFLRAQVLQLQMAVAIQCISVSYPTALGPRTFV